MTHPKKEHQQNNSKSRSLYEVTQENGHTTNEMETKRTHTIFMTILYVIPDHSWRFQRNTWKSFLHDNFKKEISQRNTHTHISPWWFQKWNPKRENTHSKAYGDFRNGIPEPKNKNTKPSQLWLIWNNGNQQSSIRTVTPVASERKLWAICVQITLRANTLRGVLWSQMSHYSNSTITKSIWQILEQPKVCGFLWTY